MKKISAEKLPSEDWHANYSCCVLFWELQAKISTIECQLFIIGRLSFSLGSTSSDTTNEKISMPKRCPHGFTQHLVVIDEDCEINYCTKANFLTAKGLPTIKRPPFHSKPKFNTNIMIPLIIENNDTNKVYIRLEEKGERWIELTPK